MENPKVELKVGRHAIEARGEGLVGFSILVDIEYGDTRQVDVVLPDDTVLMGGSAPFRSRWWTWALGGAGMVAVGLGTYFNSLQADVAQRVNDRAHAGTLTVDHQALYAEEEEHWNRALVFYGSGGVLLLGTAVMWTVDFF